MSAREHPVRLVVTDDLRRSRLTVLFRLLLAIPHYFWFVVWSIGAFFVGLVNWVLAFVTGRAPGMLHGFLAAYVRYSTHLLAYLTLAANPYPGFVGDPGYPVDLEIDGPERQNRWVTAFRLFLAIPAIMIGFAFIGGIGGGYEARDGRGGGGANVQSGVTWTVAFLAWFACLVLGRMPEGFRNLQAYGLRYLAQLSAYVLVLTDRYPDADPALPPSSGPEHPVGLSVRDDLRRSRLTVFFRLLLAIPHFVWVVLWAVAVLVAAVVTWLATLVAGRPPRALHRFLSAFLRYAYHLNAFVYLTANPFPGFTGRPGSYPVELELPPPERQRRLVTAFRLLLALPAVGVAGGLGLLLLIAAFLGWFAALATGRMPRSLRDAQAYGLRYGGQVGAYLLLVTDRYPYSGPTLGRPEPEPEPYSEAAAA